MYERLQQVDIGSQQQVDVGFQQVEVGALQVDVGSQQVDVRVYTNNVGYRTMYESFN